MWVSGVIFLFYVVLLQNAISFITGVIVLPKIKLWCSQSLILCLNANSNLILWVFLFSINLHTPGHLKAFSTPHSQPLASPSTTVKTFLQSLLLLHIFSFFFCCWNGWNTVAQPFKDRDLWLLPKPPRLQVYSHCLWRMYLWEPWVIATYWKESAWRLWITIHFTILFLLYLPALVFQKSPININEPTNENLMLTSQPSQKKSKYYPSASSPVRFDLASIWLSLLV